MSRSVSLTLSLIAIVLIGAGSAFAQAPARARSAQESPLRQSFSYWPLAVGNVWTYTETTRSRIFASDGLEIRVVAEETHGRSTYFRVVEMFGQEALLRVTSQGDIVEWDPEQDLERPWYRFSLPVGGTWRPKNGEECTGEAVIASRDQKITVAAGFYEDALKIDYGFSPCSDAGVGEEVFARGVGLLSREIITIAGPRTFELREASIGGNLLSGPGLSFGLSVDQTSYTPNLMPPVDSDRAVPTLEALIVVENTTDQALTLEFSSGQQFDFEIRSADGESVYRWSADKSFIAALTSLELSPGRKTFLVSTPLGNRESATPWPAGRYLVEAWLTTVGDKAYSAVVPIEITEPVF